MSKDGKVLDQLDPNFDDQVQTANMIRDSLQNSESCNINGKILLERVNLTIINRYIGNRINSV
jgi:hypothetical protein